MVGAAAGWQFRMDGSGTHQDIIGIRAINQQQVIAQFGNLLSNAAMRFRSK